MLDGGEHRRVGEDVVGCEGECDRGGLGAGGEEDDGFVDELLVRRDDVAFGGAGWAEEGVEDGRVFVGVGGAGTVV